MWSVGWLKPRNWPNIKHKAGCLGIFFGVSQLNMTESELFPILTQNIYFNLA